MQLKSVQSPLNSLHSFSPTRFFHSAFLPTNFPESVSPDYAQYQTWDSIQAAASTILAVLSSAAVLQASLEPTTTNATDNSTTLSRGTLVALSLLSRDMWMRLASVSLSTASSRVFDSNPKQWRLAADLLNDVAMAAEVLIMPRLLEAGLDCAPLLVAAAVARAVVGVAGGATRATFALHQAGTGGHNVGELAAKDGNQETAVNLVGSALGAYLLLAVDGNATATVTACLLLMLVHIFANYRACQVCALRPLNRHRLLILLRQWEEGRRTLATPNEMRMLEPVFPTPSRLWGPALPATVGLPIDDFLARSGLSAQQAAKDVQRTGVAVGTDQTTGETLVVHTAEAPARAVHAAVRRSVTSDDDWNAFVDALTTAGWDYTNTRLHLPGVPVVVVE